MGMLVEKWGGFNPEGVHFFSDARSEAAPHPALRATFSPRGERGEKGRRAPVLLLSPFRFFSETGRGQGEGLFSWGAGGWSLMTS
jgi:hypothetical protein